MNKAIFTDTVTLYNYIKAGREDVWTRTVLKGVQARTGRTESSDGEGTAQQSESLSLTIPFDVDSGGKPYAAPEALTETSWTLKADNGMDIVVMGVCELMPGAELSIDKLMQQTEAYTISSVRDNTRRRYLKHWKVGGY